MKRYFTFTTPPDPETYRPHGRYHYMSLPSGGYVCVVDEEGTEIPADWTELPHLLDSTTPAGLSDYGCKTTDTMFQAAMKLSKANPRFRP